MVSVDLLTRTLYLNIIYTIWVIGLYIIVLWGLLYILLQLYNKTILDVRQPSDLQNIVNADKNVEIKWSLDNCVETYGLVIKDSALHNEIHKRNSIKENKYVVPSQCLVLGNVYMVKITAVGKNRINVSTDWQQIIIGESSNNKPQYR